MFGEANDPNVGLQPKPQRPARRDSAFLAQQDSVSPLREEGPEGSDGVITPSGGREERIEEE